MSAPARELWIEIIAWLALVYFKSSAPARELWIEIPYHLALYSAKDVSSCEGAVD